MEGFSPPVPITLVIYSADTVQVHSSMEGGFHSMGEVLENKDGKYKMHYGHRFVDVWN